MKLINQFNEHIVITQRRYSGGKRQKSVDEFHFYYDLL